MSTAVEPITLAHCQSNARSLTPNPLVHQNHQRDADINADQQLAEAEREVQAFRAWRREFLEPRYDAWVHLDQGCEHAELTAAHAVHGCARCGRCSSRC